jgi:hypothetical protein
MIERHTIIRTPQAAARSWRVASRPCEETPRTPSSQGALPSPDPPRPPLRLMTPGARFIPPRSELRRCSSKGCVFPASAHGMGKCWQHELEELEPTHFLSCQPTHWLLDRAKFGLPDEECDDSRARDRRRLAALREQFLDDAA